MLPAAGSLSWPLGDIFREIEWERGEGSEVCFWLRFSGREGENRREITGKLEKSKQRELGEITRE